MLLRRIANEQMNNELLGTIDVLISIKYIHVPICS